MTVYQTDPSGPDSEITQDESIVADAVQAGGSDGFDLASATASPVGEAGGAQSQQFYQHLHPGLLMEEDDPVLMSSNKDPTEDPADDALMALEGSDFETSGCGTSVQFSLDDLASFAHPFGSHTVCHRLTLTLNKST